jgi:hypothetical protein
MKWSSYFTVIVSVTVLITIILGVSSLQSCGGYFGAICEAARVFFWIIGGLYVVNLIIVSFILIRPSTTPRKPVRLLLWIVSLLLAAVLIVPEITITSFVNVGLKNANNQVRLRNKMNSDESAKQNVTISNFSEQAFSSYNDGQYDSIQVSFNITVNESGDYQIISDIYSWKRDMPNAKVYLFSNYRNKENLHKLQKGVPKNISIKINAGEDLFEEQVNGPYKITIWVYKVKDDKRLTITGDPLLIQKRPEDVYQFLPELVTKPYSYTDFVIYSVRYPVR